MGTMHAGKIQTNATLQSLLAYLRERIVSGATSMDLMRDLNMVAPATWVSMLRKNGYNVECEYESVSAVTGRKTYRYRLVSA